MLFRSVQLATIIYLLATGPWLAIGYWLWLEVAGGLIAVWALATMPPRQLRVFPEVATGAQLIRRGPYRWVRHPMYLSVLVTALALVATTPTPSRIGMWGVLLVDLIWKLQHEEALLAARFPEYPDYRQRTKRLIPFVY